MGGPKRSTARSPTSWYPSRATPRLGRLVSVTITTWAPARGAAPGARRGAMPSRTARLAAYIKAAAYPLRRWSGTV